VLVGLSTNMLLLLGAQDLQRLNLQGFHQRNERTKSKKIGWTHISHIKNCFQDDYAK
jgi:hypothetical protein